MRASTEFEDLQIASGGSPSPQWVSKMGVVDSELAEGRDTEEGWKGQLLAKEWVRWNVIVA